MTKRNKKFKFSQEEVNLSEAFGNHLEQQFVCERYSHWSLEEQEPESPPEPEQFIYVNRSGDIVFRIVKLEDSIEIASDYNPDTGDHNNIEYFDSLEEAINNRCGFICKPDEDIEARKKIIASLEGASAPEIRKFLDHLDTQRP